MAFASGIDEQPGRTAIVWNQRLRSHGYYFHSREPRLFDEWFRVTTDGYSESGRLMYQADLGPAVPDSSGRIAVFIDDYSPDTTANNRSWYDGVGYAQLIASNPDCCGRE